MKFKRRLIDKMYGHWNRIYSRYDRYIVQEEGYIGEAKINGKIYPLQLFKLSEGWRLGIYGIMFGKELHFRTIAEAEERAEKEFTDYLFWQGEENLRRQEYEYKRYSKQSVLELPG